MAKYIRRTNVKDGILLPLGNGFSLVKGNHPNKVDDVDIGPNNKNGLSVNHGEILQQKGNTLRVFSAEPMFGGISPTQLLYRGLAPDKVFAMQEQYKRTNRIADNGTKYKLGGNDNNFNIFNNNFNYSSKKKKLNKRIVTYTGNNNYIPSKNILNYIKSTEGFRENWYKDGNGIDTIGYGFTGSEMRKKYPNGMTKEQGDAEFNNKIEQRVNILIRDTPNFDKLNQNQRDALLSYLYNVGEGNYRNKHPKLQQALIDENWEEVRNNMDAGYNDTKNRGLKIRRDYERALFDIPSDFKFGGQINKQSLGERPNANNNYMKNKRKKGLYGIPPGRLYDENNNPLFDTNLNAAKIIADSKVAPRTFIGGINLGNTSSIINADVTPYEGSLTNPYQTRRQIPLLSPVDTSRLNSNHNKIIPRVPTQSGVSGTNSIKESFNKIGNFLKSGTGQDLLSTSINVAGSLIGAAINKRAINNLKFTDRQYVLLDPVKLKTKINIAPQVAEMKNTVAKLVDAGNKTSASSRNAYQKAVQAHQLGSQSLMNLYGQKENQETQLINADLMNQQRVRHQNAKNVMDTINYNIEGKTNLENTKTQLKAQNRISLVNNIAGAIAGPNGLIARGEARRKNYNDMFMAGLPYLEEVQSLLADGKFDEYSKLIRGIANGGRIGG